MNRYQRLIENLENIKERIHENAVNNKNHINDLFHPLALDVSKIETRTKQILNEVHDLSRSFLAYKYDHLENDPTYCDIIMIPYDYYNNDALVIHHGKRIDAKNINNLTLDWDRNEAPRLTIDK